MKTTEAGGERGFDGRKLITGPQMVTGPQTAHPGRHASGKAMTVAVHETEEALRGSALAAQPRAATATTPLTAPREEEIYEVVEDVRF